MQDTLTQAPLFLPEVLFTWEDIAMIEQMNMEYRQQQQCYYEHSPAMYYQEPVGSCMQTNDIPLSPHSPILPLYPSSPISPYSDCSYECEQYLSPYSSTYSSPSPHSPVAQMAVSPVPSTPIEQELKFENTTKPVKAVKVSFSKKKSATNGITKPRKTNREPRKLPEQASKILNDWFQTHYTHPYPSQEEKEILIRQTGLTKIQIKNWFVNHRCRSAKM